MARIRYKEAMGLELKRGRPLKGTVPSKEELARLYSEKGKTAEEIGQAFGCSQDISIGISFSAEPVRDAFSHRLSHLATVRKHKSRLGTCQ